MTSFVWTATRHCAPAALVLALAGPALAQDLVSELSFAIVETDSKGEERLAAREAVRPGETIEYALVSRNLSEEDALEGVVVGAPVPEGTRLIPASATSSLSALLEVQAELDPEAPGLEWSGLPAFRTIRTDEGDTVTEPLPDTEIVALRWRFEETLPPGGEARTTYRLIVD